MNSKKSLTISLFTKLILLVVLALLPRLLLLLKPDIITVDGMIYIKMAKLFGEGSYARIPGNYFNLYPILIFLAQKFVGDWELSAQMISVFFGSLTVVPVFLVGRSLYDERIGWFSAIFYIVLPDLLKFDIQVIRDPIMWFFAATSLWLVWEGNNRNRLLPFALASISIGLGALTRVEGTILWGALVLYTVFQKRWGTKIRRKVVHLTLLILVFPVLLVPTLPFLKKDFGQIAIHEMTSFSFNFIMNSSRMILKPLDPIKAMEERVYDSLPQISKNSLVSAKRHRITLAVSEVIHRFLKSANFLVLLILLGIWKRKREGFVAADRYLLLIFAVLFFMSVFYARHIYYFSTRHGMTLALPVLLFAGHGLDFSAEAFSRGFGRFAFRWPFARKHFIHLLTIFFIIVFLIQGVSFKSSGKYIQKETGLWLKENGYQGSVIMGPKAFLRLPFYADGKFLEMPDSWDKVAESIRQNEVKIVVVDPSTIDQDCAGFSGNWSRAGLSTIQGPEGAGRKCSIQIFRIP
ncbi:MAG: ArnT family glycosyltransferase [Thermodesulfobacteriota bacterium]